MGTSQELYMAEGKTNAARTISSFYHACFIYRFPRLYDALDSLVGLPQVYATVLDWAQPQPGERILDVCCGTGSLALRMAERMGQEGEVVGIDLSPRMIARAQSKANSKPVTFLVANSQDIPYPDGYFHKATVSMALHEMPRQGRENTLREMARVTRAGGRVVLGEPRAPRNGLQRFFERLLEPPSLLEMDGLPGEVEGSGLSIVKHEFLRRGIVQTIWAEKSQ
jgi:demethylmenaquinone methyltransferase/2-methoxy-6-polyprenyl-1,4-benzoquinol methylase/phosphoethanolamine N-methyltransferase